MKRYVCLVEVPRYMTPRCLLAEAALPSPCWTRHRCSNFFLALFSLGCALLCDSGGNRHFPYHLHEDLS